MRPPFVSRTGECKIPPTACLRARLISSRLKQLPSLSWAPEGTPRGSGAFHPMERCSYFEVMGYLLHKAPSPENLIGAKIRLSGGSISAATDFRAHRASPRRWTQADGLRVRGSRSRQWSAPSPSAGLRKLGFAAQSLLHDPDKNRALSCNE